MFKNYNILIGILLFYFHCSAMIEPGDKCKITNGVLKNRIGTFVETVNPEYAFCTLRMYGFIVQRLNNNYSLSERKKWSSYLEKKIDMTNSKETKKIFDSLPIGIRTQPLCKIAITKPEETKLVYAFLEEEELEKAS